MRERDIRNALLEELSKAHRGEGAVIINELGVCQGQARIDVAVVNGMLNGYEIKSPRDTLERLPMQAEYYNQVFHTVSIVVSVEHIDNIEQTIPEWWGIWKAEDDYGTIRFQRLRRASNNPSLNPRALVQLLWRDEMISILDALGHLRGMKSKPRRVLEEALVQYLDASELERYVLDALKRRKDWRPDLRRT